MTPELARLKGLVENALDDTLPRNSDIAQAVTDAMRHSVLGGGKRMRPLLACAACRAVGGDAEDALPAACALEFIHAYSLIHDDLPAMDDDDLRHGLPSAHIAFGEANAILAGDSLHSLAFQALVMAPHISAATKVRMIDLLARAAGWSGMAGGQCLDIAAEGETLTLDELKALHAAKTGALICASVELGALSSTATLVSEDQLNHLSQFGKKIGLAFQVIDDVLDVTQSSEKLGKPAGSDEALNKNTFPRLIGLDAARALAHDLVDEAVEILHTGKVHCDDLEILARMVVERDH